MNDKSDNPFDSEEDSKDGNPFGLDGVTPEVKLSVGNPFDEEEPTDTVAGNPFDSELSVGNPFDEEETTDTVAGNPFDEEEPTLSVPEVDENLMPYGVTVHTWDSTEEDTDGMLPYLESQLFGGNVGHASISLKVPANEEYKDFLEKYCDGDESKGIPKIPYKLVTKEVMKSKIDEDCNVSKSDEVAYTERYYEVYWSWWPSKADSHNPLNVKEHVPVDPSDTSISFTLNESIEDDMFLERDGVDFEKYKGLEDVYSLEQRMQRGVIGSHKITMAPSSVVHQRNLSDEDAAILQAEEELEIINNDSDAIDVLIKKISGHGYLRAPEKDKISEAITILESYSDSEEHVNLKQVKCSDGGMSVEAKLDDLLAATYPEWKYVTNIGNAPPEDIRRVIKSLNTKLSYKPEAKKLIIGDTEKILLDKFCSNENFNWRKEISDPKKVSEEEFNKLYEQALQKSIAIMDDIAKFGDKIESIEKVKEIKQIKSEANASNYIYMSRRVDLLKEFAKAITSKNPEELTEDVKFFLGKSAAGLSVGAISDKISKLIASLETKCSAIEKNLDIKFIDNARRKFLSEQLDYAEKSLHSLSAPKSIGYVQGAASLNTKGLIDLKVRTEATVAELGKEFDNIDDVCRSLTGKNIYSPEDINNLDKAIEILNSYCESMPPKDMKFADSKVKEFDSIVSRINPGLLTGSYNDSSTAIPSASILKLKDKLQEIYDLGAYEGSISLSEPESIEIENVLRTMGTTLYDMVDDESNMTVEEYGDLKSLLFDELDSKYGSLSNAESKLKTIDSVISTQPEFLNKQNINGLENELALTYKRIDIESILRKIGDNTSCKFTRNEASIINNILESNNSIKPKVHIRGKTLSTVQSALSTSLSSLNSQMLDGATNGSGLSYMSAKIDFLQSSDLNKSIERVSSILNNSTNFVDKTKMRDLKQYKYRVLPISISGQENPDIGELKSILDSALPEWLDYVDKKDGAQIKEISDVDLNNMLSIMRDRQKYISGELKVEQLKYDSCVKAMKREIAEEIDEMKDELKGIQVSSPVDDIEQARATHVKRGIDPTHEVKIPISLESETEGLDPKAMIKKMRELTTGEFDLSVKNCSVTSASILEAGTPKRLKQFFNNKALGTICNPSTVKSSAAKLQEHIVSGKKVSFEDEVKLSKKSPFKILENAAGKQIHKLMDKREKPAAKSLAMAKLVGLSLPLAVSSMASAIVNPDAAFKKSKQFIKFLNKNKSKSPAWGVIKAFGYISTGITLALAAIPKLIKMAFVDPFVKLANKNKQAKQSRELEEVASEPNLDGLKVGSENKPDNSADNVNDTKIEVEQVIQKPSINIIELPDDMSPKDALAKMKDINDNHDDQVVVFSPALHRKVINYQKTLPMDMQLEISLLFKDVTKKANKLINKQDRAEMEKGAKPVNPGKKVVLANEDHSVKFREDGVDGEYVKDEPKDSPDVSKDIKAKSDDNHLDRSETPHNRI